MNAAQIHLALNHAPLFLSITGGILLLTGSLRKNELVKTLSWYALLAAALFTIPVFLTGEGTEELVEHLPGVNEGAIESHEGMAKISLVIIGITGVLALAALFLRKQAGIQKIWVALSLVLSLASFGSMAWTAHLGGLIRHAEIQNGAGVQESDNENDEDGNRGKGQKEEDD